MKPITRAEFEEIADVYRRQGAKFGYQWVMGRADPVLTFDTVTDEQKAALEAAALLVLPKP
jgi:hypothetical protein